jgi:hypothetical protein
MNLSGFAVVQIHGLRIWVISTKKYGTSITSWCRIEAVLERAILRDRSNFELIRLGSRQS